GHALHGLLSDVTYPRFEGTSVKRDYVEFPSQLLENWASEPSVIKTYAKHYETGEPIPDALIEKIRNSSKFNQGFDTGEYVAAALLDLEWHTKNLEETQKIKDVNAFDRATMKKIGMIPEIAPRYYSPYFQHIFSSDGYSSGYYVYGWAQVLEADAFSAFEQAGDPFDPELSKKLRQFVFSAGSSKEEMELYTSFRGQEPSVEPLLRKRGFN
ncbi:MAG: M3 family metallopeptidase, partial [Myxococcota bacterium]